jgi:methionyl-tRNA formyltransferase
MEKLRIIFMGTPEFAVGILDTLLRHNYEVAAVITAPDKPAGRGQKIKYSAVKEYALEKSIPILQPTNLKDVLFLSELKSFNANLQIVVAFRMLPEVVWRMPKLGTFNLHASLLPNYRGAAPINWVLINGEEKTGVTTFFIDDKIDTGAMILNAETAIEPNESAGDLHDRLMTLGCETVVATLQLIEKGNVTTHIQIDTVELKTAYKLNKDNCKIDWNSSGKAIHNHIRGLSPYPSAWCHLLDNDQEWNVKIYEAFFTAFKHEEKVGNVICGKKTMKIAVTDGYLEIVSMQFPGKKKMTPSELLNGITFSESATVA